MGRFVIRRIARGLIVVFAVTVVVFVVTRMIGDPARIMLPLEATQEQRAAFNHKLGLDRPIAVQFVDYIGGVARGDFGESLWQRRPTLQIIMERLPFTLELVFPAIILAVLLSIPLGVLAALRPGSFLDRLTVTSGLVGLSIPQFWLGLILLVIFSVKLKLLPVSGTGGVNLILPIITLGLPTVGRITMVVRSSMIDELNQAYVQTAEAKGLSRARVVGVHALRNASIPALTLSGWELMRALAGYAVIVEVVFGYSGIGELAQDAIMRQDLPLLSAIVLIVAIMVVVINIAIDIMYKAIDPRIQLG